MTCHHTHSVLVRKYGNMLDPCNGYYSLNNEVQHYTDRMSPTLVKFGFVIWSIGSPLIKILEDSSTQELNLT